LRSSEVATTKTKSTAKIINTKALGIIGFEKMMPMSLSIKL
jgi:hypothetical protein